MTSRSAISLEGRDQRAVFSRRVTIGQGRLLRRVARTQGSSQRSSAPLVERAVGVQWYGTMGNDDRPGGARAVPASPRGGRCRRRDRTRRRRRSPSARRREPGSTRLDRQPRDLVHGRERVPGPHRSHTSIAPNDPCARGVARAARTPPRRAEARAGRPCAARPRRSTARWRRDFLRRPIAFGSSFSDTT